MPRKTRQEMERRRREQEERVPPPAPPPPSVREEPGPRREPELAPTPEVWDLELLQPLPQIHRCGDSNCSDQRGGEAEMSDGC